MTTTAAADPLLARQLKLPSHTYKAVKRRAEELQGDEREAYLSRVLADRERDEGAGQ
jgi:hypothetical protein